MKNPKFLFDTITDSSLRFVSDEVIKKILSHEMAAQAVWDSLRAHARGDFVQPLKPYVRPKGKEGEYSGGRFIAMPAFVGAPVNAAGLKWISGFQANIQRGLPRSSGLLILNSLETGIPYAVMEVHTLSARRTAAVANIATRLLAPKSTTRVAIYGAGPIAGEVMASLRDTFVSINEFRIYDPNYDRAIHLSKSLLPEEKFVVVKDPEECASEADVVVTATSGARSYLEHGWIKPGALIVALSLDDCTEELFLKSRVVVDDWDQCNREGKILNQLVDKGLFSKSQLAAELSDVLANNRSVRRHSKEVVLVNPMGMAIEDIAVGAVVFEHAVKGELAKVINK